MTFHFAALGVEQAESRVLNERMTFRPFFEAVEKYVDEHNLSLYMPDQPVGTNAIVKESFNFIVFCLDDHEKHAYAISDIFFKLGEPAVFCVKRAQEMIVSVKFRRIARIRKLKTHNFVPQLREAVFTKRKISMFVEYVKLIDTYTKLIDQLNADAWSELAIQESDLRTTILKHEDLINLKENRERPESLNAFNIVIGFITRTNRILIDPYVVVHNSKPLSKRIQYITMRSLDDERKIITRLMEENKIEVVAEIRYLKVPVFDYIRKLIVKIIINDKAISFIDVYEFGTFSLVPYVPYTPSDPNDPEIIPNHTLLIASPLVAAMSILLDYMNISSLTTTDDFVIKKKRFLLSKLALVGKYIDDNIYDDAFKIFPKTVMGVYADPWLLEKLRMSPPMGQYTPISKLGDSKSFAMLTQRLEKMEKFP